MGVRNAYTTQDGVHTIPIVFKRQIISMGIRERATSPGVIFDDGYARAVAAMRARKGLD